jgi:hypothetical protein
VEPGPEDPDRPGLRPGLRHPALCGRVGRGLDPGGVAFAPGEHQGEVFRARGRTGPHPSRRPGSGQPRRLPDPCRGRGGLRVHPGQYAPRHLQPGV